MTNRKRATTTTAKAKTHGNVRLGRSPSASPIAIAIGDPGGIGPEVTLRAIRALGRGSSSSKSGQVRFLLLGDAAILRHVNARLDLGLSLPLENEAGARDRIVVHDDGQAPLAAGLPSGNPEHARAALRWLEEGARLCLRGEAAALVTAPVNKEAIIRAGHRGFVGQTELLSSWARTQETAMMLLGHDDRGRWLRVALATIHVPLANVARSLTREKVQRAIQLAGRACHDLGLKRARVAVCGLNPHAGEGGHLGREEITTIEPAIAIARRRGVDVIGPLAADTLFHHALRGDFDAVVAMYHDQGLAPLKMVAFDTGVNWTLGLPFIRTSPDHGTAYDIAGRGLADPSSMIAAIELARKLARTNSSAR
jgi:4-hydroxythreonine-4-phosphate dehydrogenase